MRVVVCMSGGVDSTLAAHQLKEQGHHVLGLTFSFWSFERGDILEATPCCALERAAEAAREVGVAHETIDARDAFRRIVVDDFVQRSKRGETPNPCARCNRLLRFGMALTFARDRGFEAVATGHHVRRTRNPDGSFSLERGRDQSKDQTYFLYGLRQEELRDLRFPIGAFTKQEVFERARDAGLSASELPESQDLCFAIEGETSFLFRDADLQPGPILDRAGRVVGQHRGLPRYTLGQRRGLGVSSAEPIYVIDIDVKRNALIVGGGSDLDSDRLTAVDASYISGEPPRDGRRVEAKIRYRSPAVPARFQLLSRTTFRLVFDQPQRAVTPGQIAAIYDRDRLLGGGTISVAPSRSQE